MDHTLLILYHIITPPRPKSIKENVPKKGECKAEGVSTYKQNNIDNTRRMPLESTDPMHEVSFVMAFLMVIFAAVFAVKIVQQALKVFKRAVRLVRWATQQTDEGEEERKQM
jgi:quinol-cytochrome oxidoreductase complex cytochrome b subunit